MLLRRPMPTLMNNGKTKKVRSEVFKLIPSGSRHTRPDRSHLHHRPHQSHPHTRRKLPRLLPTDRSVPGLLLTPTGTLTTNGVGRAMAGVVDPPPSRLICICHAVVVQQQFSRLAGRQTLADTRLPAVYRKQDTRLIWREPYDRTWIERAVPATRTGSVDPLGEDLFVAAHRVVKDHRWIHCIAGGVSPSAW